MTRKELQAVYYRKLTIKGEKGQTECMFDSHTHAGKQNQLVLLRPTWRPNEKEDQQHQHKYALDKYMNQRVFSDGTEKLSTDRGSVVKRNQVSLNLFY